MIKLISVVFNRPEYTELFLNSLYDVDHGMQIFPIIVSNGSRKKTQTIIQDWQNRHETLPTEIQHRVLKPEVIITGENKGFAGGINAALACNNPLFSSPGKICIMHNDTLPFAGWAKEMLDCFSFDDDIAVVIPRTNYANEIGVCIPEIRSRFEPVKICNKERCEISDLLTVIEKTYPDKKETLLDSISTTNPRFSYTIDIASFCMMFDPELLQKYGKFDEDFFPRMYEDKMWFRQMQRDGLTCFIANRAFVHHWGNITTDGPGMCFPDIAKANEEKFKKKCDELDAKYFNKTAQTTPQ